MNKTRERVLGTRVLLADSWLGRLRGFLLRPAPSSGEGLMISPCRAVHMYGMSYPLDVAFLDGGGAVVAVYPRLAPGERTGWHRAASYALELPAGTLGATMTALGDRVAWLPSESEEAQFPARAPRLWATARPAEAPVPLAMPLSEPEVQP